MKENPDVRSQICSYYSSLFVFSNCPDIGVADSTQETEALHGTAYLKVPLGYLIEMTREGHGPTTIAAALGVRKELVELRWRMAVEFDELKNILDEVGDSKVSPEELPASVYEVGDLILTRKAVRLLF